jgi:hypothetical protein
LITINPISTAKLITPNELPVNIDQRNLPENAFVRSVPSYILKLKSYERDSAPPLRGRALEK